MRVLGVKGPARSRVPPTIPRATPLAAVFSMLVGAVVLIVGWGFNVELVRALVPGTVAMKASTALMFVLCGAGLLLVPGNARRRRVGWMFAAASGMIALAFLSEYVVGWNLGIDELPFRDVAGHAAHIAYPGRLAPTTAVCFVLSSFGLFALPTHRRVAAGLLVPVVGVAALALIGYAYSIPAFYGPSSAAKMALNTAIAFLVLAAGVMFAGPSSSSQKVSSTDLGVAMARRLLPLAVVVPFVLGWLRLVGQDDGLFGLRVGTWLLTMTTITSLIAVIGWAAASLSRTDAQRRRLECELQRMADEDALTRLPNRRAFEEQLRHELALAARHQIPGALLMLDLDMFKTINDDYGHAAGDALLQAVGDTLKARLRETDALGRLGGDEFVAYLPHTEESAALSVAEDLRVMLQSASAELGPGIATTVSIGLAVVPTFGLDIRALLKVADEAMYQAKRAGGNRVARVVGSLGRREGGQNGPNGAGRKTRARLITAPPGS